MPQNYSRRINRCVLSHTRRDDLSLRGKADANMTMDALFFYFLMYSLFGWILENVYSYLTEGVFWKEGFLKGPFKPMYGVTPLLLLLIGAGRNIGVIMVLCLVIPTIVEYISGYLLKRVFHQQWWNYTENRMQLHGHICLQFSLYWAGLSLVFLRYIHPSIQGLYTNMEPIWVKASPIFLLLFLVDLVWTYQVRRRPLKNNLIEQ